MNTINSMDWQIQLKKRSRLNDISEAQKYLSALKFDQWTPFRDIPEHLFTEVFALMEERHRGWVYLFDDFAQSFRKELSIGVQKSTHREPSLTKRRKHHRATNEIKFNDYTSTIRDRLK